MLLVMHNTQYAAIDHIRMLMKGHAASMESAVQKSRDHLLRVANPTA